MKSFYQVRTGVDINSITNEAALLISSKADALRAQTDERYQAQEINPLHDEAYMEILKRGLKLKKDADIFTEEERAFFGQIDSAEDEARQLFSSLSREKDNIEKAMEAESLYAGTIRPEGESLSELLEQNENEQGAVMDIISQLIETRSIATGIGWERYEAMLRLDSKRTVAEARALIEELKAVTFLETESIKLEFTKALHIQYETDSYEANTLLVLQEDISQEGIEEVLTPLLYHHRKALEGKKNELDLIDSYIEKKKGILTHEPATEVELEQYTSPFPDNYYFPKDKISNSLTKLDSGIKTPVALESKEEKKRGTEITGYVYVNFEGINDETSVDGLTISAKPDKAIEPYEKLVINAIFTVWENAKVNGDIQDGTATTTLRNLYRIITQNQSSDPTEEVLLELKRILGRLATGYMELDVSEEAKHHKNMGDFAERSGAFMQVVVDRKRVHGKLTDVVYISRLDLTPLYAYASVTNRIASVPMKQLETKSRNKNKETMFIGDYILSRIEAIPHISSTIVIDSLLENTGIYEADYKNWKDKKAKTIKKVLDILDGYKRTGLIKDYTINKRGRIKQYSITIKK